MIKAILTQDDEFGVLRKPTTMVAAFDAALANLVDDMWDTMYHARGVGLAATQIGSSLRVAVIDTILRSNSHRNLVLVNPTIVAAAGEQTSQEGCLSMPGQYWPITRAASVIVDFQDLRGVRRSMTARELLARAIQHECDHLDGILCNSRVNADDEIRIEPSR